MNDAFRELLRKHNLVHFGPTIEEFVLLCIAFDLVDINDRGISRSRLSGNASLPAEFEWPCNNGRPIELILQVDLAEVAPFDAQGKLPASGLLTFFFDMEEQPWGFDPKDSQGFMVLYSSAEVSVHEHISPVSEFALEERLLKFRTSLSVPAFGSRAYDRLEKLTRFSDVEADRFADFSTELAHLNSNYPPDTWGGRHRLLGHSDNVQGDMQVEVALVTNGVYCGDATGYQDPRSKTLESNADDWILLMQIDSDESADMMWGDVGAIYFWIRTDDLANKNFDNVWLILQCS